MKFRSNVIQSREDTVENVQAKVNEPAKGTIESGKHVSRENSAISAKIAEEKYQMLTAFLPEIIIETDKEGKITFANMRTIDAFDYGSDIFDLNISDLIDIEDKEHWQTLFKTVMSGEMVPETELRAITRSGHIFSVSVYASRKHENHMPMGLNIVMFDMTKEKHAEREISIYKENMFFLSNTALKFLTFSNEDDIFIYIGKCISKIVPKSVIAVFSYDSATDISYIRYISGIFLHIEQIINILGNSPEDFPIKLPRKFRMRYFSKKELKPLQDAKDLLEDDESSKKVERIFRLLKLKEFYAMGMSRKGKLYGGLLFAPRQKDCKVDVPLIETFIYQAGIALHRNQIEIELKKAKEAAEESDRLKSAFLANMSHEVRTPLNSILGLAQLLMKPEINRATCEEYVQLIVESGNSLLSLIEDIMDISRIEAKQLQIKYRPLKINSLMDQLYSIFLAHPLYVQKQQKLKLRCKKHVPDISTLSDPERLQQIFINLIGNALKFTEKGHVEFGYEVEKKNILFFVADTGIGIPKNKISGIFNRFTQVDNTLARKFRGSGLGLAISKGLVELLDGTIWCKSSDGEGSVFYFTIPYRLTSLGDELPENSKDDHPDYNWAQYTILIVEDDYINSKVLDVMLQTTKATLVFANTGMKAIDIVHKNNRIDLVLMDMHLPKISGLEASKIILKHRPDMPIIAQTANAMSDDKDRCLNAGCVDYISKPIDMHNLFAKISKHLPEK
ncbi:MAG: response regulator [Bacteroidales bacterium]|jgi:PAS domain S-box-containing protein|nr:response regulator [Bacteroidales bacterium]